MKGLVIALSVTGCGTEVIETAPPIFEPLCGEDGPVELLVLEDHEQVGWVDSLGPEAELLVSTIAVGTDGLPAHNPPRTVQHVLVDRCGETVVPAPPNVYFMHRWDDVLLACARDGVVQLDEASGTNPRLLVRNACFMPPTSEGRVAIDVDLETLTSRVVTLTKSGTEVTVSTLLDGVHVPADPISRHTPLVIDDRVLVMMSDLRLVSVDTSTGNSRVEVEAVTEFSATSDAVLYRPPTTDPAVASPVWLRDRSTGVDELVDAALPASWGIGLSMERGLIVLRRGGVNSAGNETGAGVGPARGHGDRGSARRRSRVAAPDRVGGARARATGPAHPVAHRRRRQRADRGGDPVRVARRRPARAVSRAGDPLRLSVSASWTEPWGDTVIPTPIWPIVVSLDT